MMRARFARLEKSWHSTLAARSTIEFIPPLAIEVPDMTDDERAIRKLVDTWLSASKAGDLETVLSLIAEDAVFMVPGQKPFGKEAFMTASQGLEHARIEARSDIQELQVLGDWAFLRNYLDVTMTPSPDAQPVRRTGYTLTILRKETDGRWVLARDANLQLVQN
jgi:uncharacterized protein (TIGR02246 family)